MDKKEELNAAFAHTCNNFTAHITNHVPTFIPCAVVGVHTEFSLLSLGVCFISVSFSHVPIEHTQEERHELFFPPFY